MTSDTAAIQIHKMFKVLPGHLEVMGEPASLNGLLSIVRQYPVFEWLNYLSRMQNNFWGENAVDRERIRHVFFGAISKDIQQRIIALESRDGKHTDMNLFYPRQISTLQQLVLLHAPEEGTQTFNNEQGRHDLGRALLMTFDLMNEGRPDDADHVLASLVQDQIRMVPLSPERYAARAIQFYQLAQSTPHRMVTQFLDLYEIATGVNARDSLLGGWAQVIRESVKKPKELAERWEAVAAPENCENPKEARVLRASREVRWRCVEDIRTTIKRLEGNAHPRDWNLIAFSMFPIVDFGSRGAFVLDHTALGVGLFHGVRHAVLTAAIDNRLPAEYGNAQSIGGMYGRIFQRYVTRIFQSAAPKRVMEILEDNDDPRCDLLVWFPEFVVLIEIKAEHFIAKSHSAYRSLAERREELRNIGIPRAVKQIAATIRALRSGNLPVKGLLTYDWTTVPIVPLIVTEEAVPAIPSAGKCLYSAFDEPLEELRSSGPVGRLRILPIDDIESLPDVSESQNWASLMYRWGESDGREQPWHMYLDTSGVKLRGDVITSRSTDAVKYLATQLGLDLGELDIESSH